jgi:hypothetical protein
VGRTLLSVAFDVDFDFALRCHPEEPESHAERATPDEGSMQLACRGPTDQDSPRLFPSEMRNVPPVPEFSQNLVKRQNSTVSP